MALSRTIIVLALLALAVSVAAQTPSPAPLDEAKALIAKGKYADAIPILQSVVSSDKASTPQALRMIGESYKALKSWTKAIESFEKLLAECPNSAPDREVKSWIMDCHLANGDTAKALAMRASLIGDYGPDAWKLHYVVGRRYVWQHKYAQAIPELEKAVQLGPIAKDDPEMLDANGRLLHSYVQEKQWPKAENLAQRLLTDYPSQAYQWHGHLGRCYQGQQEYEKAVESLELAVGLSPKSASALRDILKTLLQCYEASGASQGSLSLVEKLVAEYPNEPAWQWKLGCCYMSDEKFDRAADCFRKVVETSKRRWEIRSSQIYLGECLYHCGKGTEALATIDAYYKDKADAWDEYLLVKGAVLFHGAKDDDGCVTTLNGLLDQVRAGKRSTLVTTAKEVMYQALDRMGRRSEAAIVLEQMAAESRNPLWACRAADAYYAAGNRADAKRLYKSVLDGGDAPDDIKAACTYGLAVYYWDAGLKNCAKRLMRQLTERYPRSESCTKAQGTLYLWSQQ